MKVRCGGWVDAVKSLGLSLHSEALVFSVRSRTESRRREEDRVGLEALVSEEFLSTRASREEEQAVLSAGPFSGPAMGSGTQSVLLG